MPTGVYERKPRSEEYRKNISLSHLGKPLSEAHRKALCKPKSNTQKMTEWKYGRNGEQANRWKGEKIGMTPLHIWIKKNKPKPKNCEHCKQEKTLECANISGLYLKEINDYEWLCQDCHYEFDKKNRSRWGCSARARRDIRISLIQIGEC